MSYLSAEPEEVAQVPPEQVTSAVEAAAAVAFRLRQPICRRGVTPWLWGLVVRLALLAVTQD